MIPEPTLSFIFDIFFCSFFLINIYPFDTFMFLKHYHCFFLLITEKTLADLIKGTSSNNQMYVLDMISYSPTQLHNMIHVILSSELSSLGDGYASAYSPVMSTHISHVMACLLCSQSNFHCLTQLPST